MRQLLFFSAYLLIFCVLSCASPQKRLKKQDYQGAYKAAIKELKKGKNPRDNKVILQKGLSAVLAEKIPVVKQLSNSEQVKDLEKALKESNGLQDKITEADQYLRGAFDESKNDLVQLDEQNSQAIYDISFAAGQSKLAESISTGYKEPAINAHAHFEKARQYTRETQKLDSLMNVCYEYGTYIYVVSARGDSWDINRQFDDVEGYSGAFLEVYYDRFVSDVDCEIAIDFRDLDFDLDEDDETLRFEKEIVDGYDVEVDTAGVETEIPIYKTVEGGVVVTKIERVGTWEASVRVRRSRQNCGLSDNSFSAERRSEIFEYETFGDERAIPSEYEDGRSGKLVSEDDMEEEMLEEIYADFVRTYF